MNKKAFAIVLVPVLAVSISLSIVLYFQNQNEQQPTDPYTVIGTLSYSVRDRKQPASRPINIEQRTPKRLRNKHYTRAANRTLTYTLGVLCLRSGKRQKKANSDGLRKMRATKASAPNDAR
jgi:hypothetical protein